MFRHFRTTVFRRLNCKPQTVKNLLFFDEHMDTSVIVDFIKKILKFLIFQPNFCVESLRNCDEKNFSCKILGSPIK